jgi:hypothetical protein
MTIDPKSLVSVIDRSGAEVRLSELDALCSRQAAVIGGDPSPADVTAGLRAALGKGWLRSDGLRVFVSSTGRKAVGVSG